MRGGDAADSGLRSVALVPAAPANHMSSRIESALTPLTPTSEQLSPRSLGTKPLEDTCGEDFFADLFESDLSDLDEILSEIAPAVALNW